MPKNPLVLHKSEWNRLKVQISDEKKLSAAEQQTAYVQSLNEASYNMTKMWDNSYERVLQRQEEERLAKKKAEDDSRMAFYRNLLEKRRIEREQMLADARDSFFKQKDEPKTLMSALMCSEVLREQEAQRVFNEQLRNEERELERQNGLNVKRESDAWLEEEKKKRQRRREINKEVAAIVIAQRENAKTREANRKQQLMEADSQFIKNSNKEQEAIRKFEIEFKMKELRAIRKQGEDAVRTKKNKKYEEQIIDELEDKIIDIYEKTNCKIKHLTELKRKEHADQKERIRKYLHDTHPNVEKTKKEKEAASCQRAIEEYEQKAQALLEKKQAFKDGIANDRKKCWEECQKKETDNREKDATFRAWEIANRFENSRHTDQFNNMMREKKKKNTEEYKEFLLMQRREVEENKKREQEELYTFYHTERLADMEAADKKFMTFATNLVEECKEYNRPIYPLLKVIDDYKARYMTPPKKLPKNLVSHIPSFSTCEKDKKKNVNSNRSKENVLEKHPEVREPREGPAKNGI